MPAKKVVSAKSGSATGRKKVTKKACCGKKDCCQKEAVSTRGGSASGRKKTGIWAWLMGE